MVKLFCAVVGEESVVTVDIEEQQAVGDLKERIKRRAGYDFPSHKLTLYRAKRNGDANGQWMTTEHADYVRLSRGGAGVEATYLTTDTRDATGKIVRKGTLMDPTWGLHNYFDANTPSEKVIHVLVKLPDVIVQVPQRAEIAPSYFILPETREKVAKAVFVIVEEKKDDNGVGMGVFKGVGMGVFFSPTLAVTCDHNLTEEDTVGSSVSLALKEEMADVVVVARNSELDYAILKSSKDRSFVAPWNGNTDDLESRCDLVLASFRLGIDEYQATYKGKLGFAPAACIAISAHRRHIMFSCPTYAGDSGAALVIKDGFLVGIHQETINALREEMDRKKVIKERLTDVEESLDQIARSGLAQGCSGLLVHEFKDVVSD